MVLATKPLLITHLPSLPGDISALMSLGAFYSQGTGVEKDYEKSFKCYKAAADKGILQHLLLLVNCLILLSLTSVNHSGTILVNVTANGHKNMVEKQCGHINGLESN